MRQEPSRNGQLSITRGHFVPLLQPQSPAMGGRHFCFTLFEEAPPLFESRTMFYLCYQTEICPVTGRFHFQGYVQFGVPHRLNGVKQGLDSETVHVETSRGTAEESRAYCAKEDSSVAGTFEEYGDIQHHGQRNDIISLKRSIEDSSSWRSVLLNEAHAHTTAKYHLK